MRSRVIALLFVSLTLVFPIVFNACEKRVLVSAEGGSGAGNPMVAPSQAAKNLLTAACSTLTRCHSQLSLSACEAGMLAASGFSARLGLTRHYPTLSEIVNSEASSTILSNDAAAISCVNTVTDLSCSSTEVTTAYNSSASDPFGNAASIVPASPTSNCDNTFASSEIRYVAKTGSDANDGSASRPWLTIQHAADLVQPGQTVLVGDGEFQETVLFKTSGTAAEPIVFRALNKWRARIAPTSTAGNGDFVITTNGLSYITVQDFEIAGTDSAKSAIQFEHGTNNAAIGNDIHGVGNTTTACFRTVGVEAASDYAVVSGNRIWNIGSPRSSSFSCNQQHGVSSYKGVGGIVQNNLIVQIWQGFGLHFDAYNFANWKISNNTVVNSGNSARNTGGPIIFWCEQGSCSGNAINNNILVDGGGAHCLSESNAGGTLSGNTYLNNLLFNCGTNNMVTGNPQNTVTVSPQFVNNSGDITGNYHLAAGSPAVDAGTASAGPPVDFDGVTRPKGSALDIGAFEN